MSISLMLKSLRMVEPARFFERLLSDRRSAHSDYFQVALFIGLGTIQLVALALTQSRGATAATAAALVVLVAILSGHQLTGAPQSRAQWAWRRVTPFLRFGAAAGVIVALLGLLSGRAAYRQTSLGADEMRLCTFQSVWTAIGDSWPYGTGFGNFTNTFPAYRNATCSGIAGVWEAAHNFYLEGLLGLGLVFAVVFGVFTVTLAWAFIYGLRHRRRYRFIPAMGLAIMVLVDLHSVVDFSLQIPGVAIFVASVFAGCVTICFVRDESAVTSLPDGSLPGMKRKRRRPQPEIEGG